jgi:hypothetical protein
MAKPSEPERIRRVLDAVRTSLPHPPRVVEIEYEVGADLADDPALYMTLLLEESTRDEDWTSANLEPIEDRIKAALTDAGIELWPYFRYARPSEWRAAG